MRERLEQVRRAIATQDQQLIAAYAQLSHRDEVAVLPAALQRFEMLCTPPARLPVAPPPTEWNALRC
jgi:hypothetical protein